MGDKEVEELARTYPKFKAFAGEVEACLQQFDRSKEWSDYVSALSKLIKVFQRPDWSDPAKVGNPSVVPEKALLARRLSQCTNAILPSGVHRKALDAYRAVLSRIGPQQIAEDLALWSAGLFSLFPHANTECKLAQMRLLTDLFLPLGAALGPCLPGLAMSLLPGVEDEASACYRECLALLDAIRDAVGFPAFFRALWWVLGSSAGTRPPLVLLLDRQLSFATHSLHTRPEEGAGREGAGGAGGLAELDVEAREALVPRGGIVLRGLCAALRDPSILVQRGVLDVMIGHFPVGARVLSSEDWDTLIRVALVLYARRDLSLTRRLHSWLLAPGPVASTVVSVSVPGAKSRPDLVPEEVVTRVVSALTALLQAPYSDTAGATAPLRVARALLDRQELAETLTPRLAVPLLAALSEAERGGVGAGGGDGG